MPNDFECDEGRSRREKGKRAGALRTWEGWTACEKPGEIMLELNVSEEVKVAKVVVRERE